MSTTPPAMSVVLIGSGSFETIRKVIRCLREQTIHSKLEVVVVTASAEELAADEEALAGFCGWRIVDIGPFAVSAHARAVGVRAATAPLVTLAEDHCYPEPTWAAALLAAHGSGDWAVVGPAMDNGNPGSAISWANFLLEYGPWMCGTADDDAAGEPKPMPLVPGRNSCYRGDLLLAYGDRLESMLDAEMTLHEDLAERGHRLAQAPAARTHHVNLSAAGAWLPVRYQSGRVLGAARVREWGAGRRCLYILGGPLIPVVRLWRTLGLMRGRLAPATQLRILPVLVMSLIADGAGEIVGYVTGRAGTAVQRLTEADFRRREMLRPGDRDLVVERA